MYEFRRLQIIQAAVLSICCPKHIPRINPYALHRCMGNRIQKKNYPKVASCQPLPLKIKPALCSILKSFKDLHNTILIFPTSLLTFVPPLYSTLDTWRAVNHSSEFRFFRIYSKRCLHYSPLEQNHHQQKGYNNHPFIRCLSYIVCVCVCAFLLSANQSHPRRSLP